MGIFINDQLIYEIKTRIDLVDVVNKYAKMEQDGNNFKCCCPFPEHNEKTPSFTVHPPGKKDWQTFYCYGCHVGNKEETGVGNDVISFIMAMEKLEFNDACQHLCDAYHIPYSNFETNPQVTKMKKEKTDLNVKYFNNLMSNNLVLSYLSERGVKLESIKKFRLGLTAQTEYYGWKRNRLVFGITDTHYDNDKVSTVAFGYRNLMGEIKANDGMEYFPNDTPTVKYRNDSESIIFDKGKLLYGMQQALKAIKARKYAIVVEGYLDTILMHQSGFENTVAPLGTGFTEAQMDLLKRHTDQILFFMDGDEAGLKAMKRMLPKLLERGFSVLIVEAPAGYDPADLVNSLNQDTVEVSKYIKSHSTPALQWCIEKSMKEYDSIVHKAKIDILGNVLPLIDKVKHRESKIAYTSQIASRINVDASAILLTKEPELINPVLDKTTHRELKPNPNKGELPKGWVTTTP